MLNGDPRIIKMVYSLMFSLPGTPVLFYGEEIGMGENLAVPGRLAVRTPMQWTAGRNGGFSPAKPSRLTAPLTTGPYGPAHVNVQDQRSDPDSLLAFISLLARRYRECPEVRMVIASPRLQVRRRCSRNGAPGTSSAVGWRARCSSTTWHRSRSGSLALADLAPAPR